MISTLANYHVVHPVIFENLCGPMPPSQEVVADGGGGVLSPINVNIGSKKILHCLSFLSPSLETQQKLL